MKIASIALTSLLSFVPSKRDDDVSILYKIGHKTLQLRKTVHELGCEAANFCDCSSKSISGYMGVKGSQYDKNDKELFFWMFEKRPDGNEEKVIDEEIPLVVFLNGGPGSSSIFSLLYENGPCSVNKDGASTTVNPYSWTEAAHVLWLDQPAGVGFSYGDENDSNEDMVSEDAYYFFQAFFKAHPEYAKNPLFLVGISYGGHYVPAISHRIWKGNQNLCDDCIKINFSGLAIGNGWVAPRKQLQWYPEMAYNNSQGIKIVNESEYKEMKAQVLLATDLIDKCNQGSDWECYRYEQHRNQLQDVPKDKGINPYDIRKKCEVPPLCYDFSNIEKWLNTESTKKALNVDETQKRKWIFTNHHVEHLLDKDDDPKDFSTKVADLLDAGFPALIYAGDLDYVCNYLGNKAWTKDLEWSHKADFNAAEELDWNDGAGIARSSNGLTFLQVVDAGHMAAHDQPKVTLEMIKTFLSGGFI